MMKNARANRLSRKATVSIMKNQRPFRSYKVIINKRTHLVSINLNFV